MKWRIENCPFCNAETWHKVRRRCTWSRRIKSSITKRVIYHCTKCNRRRNKR